MFGVMKRLSRSISLAVYCLSLHIFFGCTCLVDPTFVAFIVWRVPNRFGGMGDLDFLL